MLEPQTRTLLIDALKPPPEYRLDYAIGTTFTLDLVALLAAPLAFALLDRSGPDGRLSSDPIALLEALRRNADRFAIFCQAGRISVPKPNRLLLSYLEQNVFQVTAPHGGVFHPKVWALRFVADDGPVIYRMICSSRNLTFDRSWDTVLILEGPLTERRNAIAANHPLGDFIAALPGLVLGAIPDNVSQRIEQFQAELRRVDFGVPEGFDEYGFNPMGIGKYKGPALLGQRMDRLLVISPFVCPDGLSRLSESCAGDFHLVSRLESLEALPRDALTCVEKLSVFSDEQTDPDGESAEIIPESSGSSLEAENQPELSGLHAKVYIADQGWNATVWTGSANATAAAFQQNVEFLVGLTGRKGQIGIEAVLSADAGQAAFRSFLRDFTPSDEAKAGDAAQVALERALDQARLALSMAGLRMRVGPDGDSEMWRIELHRPDGTQIELPEGIEIRTWPITCRPDAMARPLDVTAVPAPLAVFAPLTFEALTSFVAIDIAVVLGPATGRVQFVLNLPAEGFPVDRPRRLLLKLLDNREAVMRYLHLLLEFGQQGPEGDFGAFRPMGGGAGTGNAVPEAQPLLEPLIRALHREPSRLDDVARLVDDLKQAGAVAQQLPAGFDDIWQPIWEAKRRLSDEKPVT